MNGNEENQEKPEVGKFRTILPQVTLSVRNVQIDINYLRLQILASTAKNFLLLDLGMASKFTSKD